MSSQYMIVYNIHTTDPETKDQAEATRLPYWVTRLSMQSTGDSILDRHEC